MLYVWDSLGHLLRWCATHLLSFFLGFIILWVAEAADSSLIPLQDLFTNNRAKTD